MKSFIARIKEINPILNCVVDTRFDEALEEAQAADTLIRLVRLPTIRSWASQKYRDAQCLHIQKLDTSLLPYMSLSEVKYCTVFYCIGYFHTAHRITTLPRYSIWTLFLKLKIINAIVQMLNCSLWKCLNTELVFRSNVLVTKGLFICHVINNIKIVIM